MVLPRSAFIPLSPLARVRGRGGVGAGARTCVVRAPTVMRAPPARAGGADGGDALGGDAAGRPGFEADARYGGADAVDPLEFEDDEEAAVGGRAGRVEGGKAPEGGKVRRIIVRRNGNGKGSGNGSAAKVGGDVAAVAAEGKATGEELVGEARRPNVDDLAAEAESPVDTPGRAVEQVQAVAGDAASRAKGLDLVDLGDGEAASEADGANASPLGAKGADAVQASAGESAGKRKGLNINDLGDKAAAAGGAAGGEEDVAAAAPSVQETVAKAVADVAKAKSSLDVNDAADEPAPRAAAAAAPKAGQKAPGVDSSARATAAPGVAPVKMSADEIAAAQRRREEANALVAKKKEADEARVKAALERAEQVLVTVGERSGVFGLGSRARDSLEATLAEAEAEAAAAAAAAPAAGKDGQKAPAAADARQVKLKASAASALRKVASTLSDKWDETVVPVVRDKLEASLPKGYKGLSKRAITTGAVTALCAVLLLPLFLGGGSPQPEKAKKKISTETTALEQKLAKKRYQRTTATAPDPAASPSSSTSPIKSAFPPETNSPRTVTASSPRAKTSFKSSAPAVSDAAPKSGAAPAEPSSAESPPSSPPALSSAAATATGSAAKSVGAAATTAASTAAGTTGGAGAAIKSPAAPVAAPAPPAVPAAPEKPVAVTETAAVAGIKAALGSRSSYVVGGSFDTLATEPTVIVEVTRGFHSLPADDQRSFADAALRSTRSVGYDAVSIVETGTESELVHAGIDIDLNDETANLRSQLRAMQRKADKLATADANAEAQLEAVQERMEEQRVAFASDKVRLENQVKAVRAEIAKTAQDLGEAKSELAEMPDRMALEKRTEAAEAEMRKMSDTVEVLGRQVTVARDAENVAKTTAEERTSKADSLIADAERRISAAAAGADADAESRVAKYTALADAAVAEAKAKLAAAEEASAKSQAEASRSFTELKTVSERTLADTVKAKDAEIKAVAEGTERTIQTKYEALLRDLQKRANDDLDRYNAQAKADSKALDAAHRSAEQESAKLLRDKVALAKKVDSLQAKLQSKVRPAAVPVSAGGAAAAPPAVVPASQ